jgi:hypothetical protein
VRWDPDSQSSFQLTLSAIPGANRFLKVSDQGYREQQRAQQSEVNAARAREKLKLPPKVQSLEMEYWRLARLKPELRTPEQSLRYDDLKFWYNRVYRPGWETIQQARDAGSEARAAAERLNLDRDSLNYYRARP